MARKKKPEKSQDQRMTPEELASMAVSEFDNARLFQNEISAERTKSLEAYNSEPYGNEEEGLSKFVASDVRDTIEWAMPQLVDIFMGGDTPVEFTAEDENDVKAAEVESKYCQNVIMQQNNGVIVVSSWFKDALMQKNGIVKCYWNEHLAEEREEYKNKTHDEYMALENDDEFEIDECTVTVGDNELSEDEFEDVMSALSSDPAAAQRVLQDARYECVGYRSRDYSQIVIENVPPERFYVRRNHNSIFLKDCDYCCEEYPKTRSELLQMGYSRDLVDSLPTGERNAAINPESEARFSKEGGVTMSNASVTGDRSREIITIYDHYIRADFDHDGISELRLVRTAGPSAQHILENEEVDRVVYHALTPYLNSHKFFGRSLADNLTDLQRCRSQSWRNIFDNVMYSTIPRKLVRGNVNAEDLMTYVPGGIIRMTGQDASVTNETTPFVADAVFPILDRLNDMRAERSGFSKETMGLNPDALSGATNLVGTMIMSQSQLLIKMIATIMANAGFNELMLHVRELVFKNERQERIFEVAGSFLQTDPREWTKKRRTKARVGIGHAGAVEELATMNKLLELQTELVEAQQGIDGPLTNARGIFNTIDRLCKRMGIANAKTFFTDPDKYQPPPKQPSLAEIQLKAGIDGQNANVKQKDAEIGLKHDEQSKDHEFRFAELAQKERLEMAKIASDEKMKELELLYRYGSDAQDRASEGLKHVAETTRNLDAPAIGKSGGAATEQRSV